MGGFFIYFRAVDFSVLVLTNGSWPFQQGAEMRLPLELVRCQERFTTFYTVSAALQGCGFPRSTIRFISTAGAWISVWLMDAGVNLLLRRPSTRAAS